MTHLPTPPQPPSSSLPPNVPIRRNLVEESVEDNKNRLFIGGLAIALGLASFAGVVWSALQLSDGARLIKAQLVLRNVIEKQIVSPTLNP